MDYKCEGKQRPRKWSYQCAVHLGLSRERLVIVYRVGKSMEGSTWKEKGGLGTRGRSGGGSPSCAA